MGPGSIFTSGSSVAFLVFLSAPAWARVVPPHLLRVTASLLRLLLLCSRTGMSLHQALLIAAALLFHPVNIPIVRDAYRIHLLDDVGLEAAEHLREDVEALALILLKRVALTVAAQSDALFEMIHRQEVLFPVLVE